MFIAIIVKNQLFLVCFENENYNKSKNILRLIKVICMNVLFLGNSHTYFHDMPELFARLAEKTCGEKPRVTMLAYSSRDLDWHCNEYFSLRFNLMYGKYDYCVIQQAAHPFPPMERTLNAGAKIIDLCHRCGVKPIVYMTWAEKCFPENQQKMIDTCEKLAAENHALLAPIGCYWRNILTEHKDIELYHTDGEHASPYGVFLIAASFCKLIYGKISEDICGMGHDFIGSLPLDFTKPTVLEDDSVRIRLDREKCQRILDSINIPNKTI